MRITPINSLPFKATLKGDVDKIVRVSVEGGLPENVANNALKQVHKLLPSDEDRVYMYFKKYVNEDPNMPSSIRAGVKVSSNGITLEKNINICDNSGNSPHSASDDQKNLLFTFLRTVKKLVKGKITPDDKHDLYDVPKGTWLDRFEDKENTFTTATPLF